MQRWIWIIAFIIAGSLAFSWAAFAADAEQQKAVQTYITAYARNDYAKLRPLFPTKDENLFGPYLFDGMPTLKQPKVDESQALVEFTALVKDDKLLKQGGILFKRHKGVWLVRQVLFYEKIPAIFNLPKKSVTDADRRNEPEVSRLCTQFLKAWQRGDTAEVVKLSHRWEQRDGDINKGMSVSPVEITPSTTKWGESFVKYKTKLTYKWGILSYSMQFNGGFIMVKENGKWKIRGNIMVLYF